MAALRVVIRPTRFTTPAEIALRSKQMDTSSRSIPMTPPNATSSNRDLENPLFRPHHAEQAGELTRNRTASKQMVSTI